jgi:DNA repair protein SbcD/Mre11
MKSNGSIKILHFADAHIDMANYGRHDPASGLPLRVMDFLKSLDTIVDAAIDERVDMVIFAGDAYKDRTPAPTFQREWGRRVMRLSRAGIPTLLLVGNHDLAPALGRAHALETFDTLDVPHINVIDRPRFLKPDDLEGLPVQVLALPWVSRSGLMAHLDLGGGETAQVYEALEARLTDLLHGWLEQVNPALPVILTAHCSVQGAVYGGERTVMLGADLVLPASLVKDPRLDYVALGHIHKPQDLNAGAHPPVIYPGSIERVDFGEAADDKFYIIASISRGLTQVQWRKLDGVRPFINCSISLDPQETGQSEQGVMDLLRRALPTPEKITGAIVRLTVEYPRDFEALIDDAALRQLAKEAFEFHLVKRPQVETRVRLPENLSVGSLTPLELLDLYWQSSHIDPAEIQALNELAGRIIQEEG